MEPPRKKSIERGKRGGAGFERGERTREEEDDGWSRDKRSGSISPRKLIVFKKERQGNSEKSDQHSSINGGRRKWKVGEGAIYRARGKERNYEREEIAAGKEREVPGERSTTLHRTDGKKSLFREKGIAERKDDG